MGYLDYYERVEAEAYPRGSSSPGAEDSSGSHLSRTVEHFRKARDVLGMPVVFGVQPEDEERVREELEEEAGAVIVRDATEMPREGCAEIRPVPVGEEVEDGRLEKQIKEMRKRAERRYRKMKEKKDKREKIEILEAKAEEKEAEGKPERARELRRMKLKLQMDLGGSGKVEEGKAVEEEVREDIEVKTPDDLEGARDELKKLFEGFPERKDRILEFLSGLKKNCRFRDASGYLKIGIKGESKERSLGKIDGEKRELLEKAGIQL